MNNCRSFGPGSDCNSGPIPELVMDPQVAMILNQFNANFLNGVDSELALLCDPLGNPVIVQYKFNAINSNPTQVPVAAFNVDGSQYVGDIVDLVLCSSGGGGGDVVVTSSVLPTGAATETTLSSLNAKVTAVNTGAVVVSSSALPSGAATAALQTTSNTNTNAIAAQLLHLTDTTQKTQIVDVGGNTIDSLSGGLKVAIVSGGGGGGNVIVTSSVLPTGASTESTLSSLNAKVTAVNTGAVVVSSSVLPTGAATSASQATGNTSLATIATQIAHLTDTTQKTQIVDVGGSTIDSLSGGLKVAIVSGGGSGGTSSTVGSAVPATATAVGLSDGTNLRLPRLFDTDTGGGVEYTTGVNLRIGGSGGSVEGGTSANPLRVDPTGTTNQPTKEIRSPTAVLSNIAATTGSQTLLPANSARLGATIANDSVSFVYVKFGSAVSSTSFTVIINANDYYEVPFGYTGIITGMWFSATGSGRMTELT